MEALVLETPHSDVRLELHPVAHPWEGSHGTEPAWRADLSGTGAVDAPGNRIAASLRFTEAGWLPQSLTSFFLGLAHEDWREFDGAREWGSVAGELRLSATYDGRDAILLTATLSEGAPLRWSCEAEFEIQLGTLRTVADEVARLTQRTLEM